jgi:predicted AAA+ superfamily ATPase
MNLTRIIDNILLDYLNAFPVLAIVGPRQVGKTTSAKLLISSSGRDAIYLDLESDEDKRKLFDPELYFNERADQLIIIDEIQRNPELFPILRSVIDKNRRNGRFVLLGSASPELLTKSSETLAGRIAYLEMHPLVYPEIKTRFGMNELWLKGGFPEMLLQKNEQISLEMRVQFIQTYLERELPILGLSASPILLKNLLRMIAHAQGQICNYTEFSKSLGIDINTVKRYLDYFENAFLIRRLEPYFFNSKKRLVKSPKIFIRDTGLLHALFNIENQDDLSGFIGRGNSWESFVIQQVIAVLKNNISYYFYRTQDGTELDLLLVKGYEPVLGIEIKTSNAPSISRGTGIASKDLGDISVFVVTPSVSEMYKHNERTTVMSFDTLISQLELLKLTKLS